MKHRTLSLLIILFPALALADTASDKQAWQAAQATDNPYVINAVRQQLLKEHPEYHSWLAEEDAVHSTPSRAEIMTPEKPTVTAPAQKMDEVQWKGEVEGGMENDTGNTRNLAFNGKGHITRDSEDWLFLAQTSLAYAESKDVVNTENYRALGQANYKLKPDKRLMTTLFWNSNRFTGFKDRFEEVSGLSDDWKLPGKMKLTTEIAAGARQVVLTDNSSSVEPILWARGSFTWPFAERWTLAEDLRNSLGPKYNFLWSNTSLTTPLDDRWKLRLSLEADDVNNPPLRREPLDTTSLVSLVYGF